MEMAECRQSVVEVLAEENAEGSQPQVSASTKEAFDKAHRLWTVPELKGKIRQVQEAAISDEKLKKAVAAAAASQKQEFKVVYPALPEPGFFPTARQGNSFSATDVDVWLVKKHAERKKDGQSLLKMHNWRC